MMGMTPSNFWECSPKEVYMAIEGFTEFNGGEEQKEEPMSRERLNEMMELYPSE
tara:strand:+ start:2240 stop:2401 length:162 start_codon:yes stop_codon:yes gene_type:complete